VVKTKVQIYPERYPKILPSFQTVWKDEGPSTFFTGWLPTVGGHFFAGGVLYATTEVIRRSLTDAAVCNGLCLIYMMSVWFCVIEILASYVVILPFLPIQTNIGSKRNIFRSSYYFNCGKHRLCYSSSPLLSI